VRGICIFDILHNGPVICLAGLVHKDKIQLDSAKYSMGNITISKLMAYMPQIWA